MACTTTTTFAPCYCFDIKYYMDAGSFTLIHVDCSGNTIQDVYSGIEISGYTTICSQCTPYTAFTKDVQTGDYVTITPRSIVCIDSQPCPLITPTPTPSPTQSQGGGQTYYIQYIGVCQKTCSTNCTNLFTALLCNNISDCFSIGGSSTFYCCCNCVFPLSTPVYTQYNSPPNVTTNKPYLNSGLTIPISYFWSYGGILYQGYTQYCVIGSQGCRTGCLECCLI